MSRFNGGVLGLYSNHVSKQESKQLLTPYFATALTQFMPDGSHALLSRCVHVAVCDLCALQVHYLSGPIRVVDADGEPARPGEPYSSNDLSGWGSVCP
jgi:hypothetical protein